MDRHSWLTQRFEENRPRLRGVAYRMLGSLSEADDAVQEAWLRLHGVDADTIQNLGGWLTTVVSRVCLDMLRARTSRREEPIGAQVTEPRVVRGEGADPEGEALFADSVGVALLVVLDTLTPAERLVFVLHDLFAVPFDEIGAIVGRSPAAAKQLASRARRRVRGSTAPADAGRVRQREVVEAFLRAVRNGDLEGLLAVLDPDAVIRIDGAARIAGGAADAANTPRELRGAATWARQLIAMSRGLPFVQPAVINGSVGLILAPGGKLSRVLVFSFTNAKIARLDVIGDPAHLRELDIAVPQIVPVLARNVGAPVVNETGLGGADDIRLEWSQQLNAGSITGEPEISLFTALRERLGLQLEPVRVPADIIIVDRIARLPTPTAS